MKNRIKLVNRLGRSVTPLEAEVWLVVIAENITPTTEVRGRLVGPRCRYSTTVEVAYPFRSPPRAEGLPPLAMRAIIPEPCLWDPQSPFLYRAAVELWEDGERCDEAGFDVGLRTLDLGTSGAYWNGRRLRLRGITRLPRSDAEALELRQRGYNLLFGDLEWPHTWFSAYQFGFFVLAQVPMTERALLCRQVVGGLPSSLGWILGKEALEETATAIEGLARWRDPENLLGVELEAAPRYALPGELTFVVCPERSLRQLRTIQLPKLVLREGQAGQEDAPPWAADPGILGWVDKGRD